MKFVVVILINLKLLTTNMKTLLAFAIFSLGVVSPVMYSYITNNPSYVWASLTAFLFTGYATYKIRFKTKNRFKRFIFRHYVKFRQLVDKINTKMQSNPQEIEALPIQYKSVRLWKLLLRDMESQISCSLGNRIRQIEKDNMLLILSPINERDFMLTIMDVDSVKSCLYEIPIHSKYSETLIEIFDTENEKRMAQIQKEKKQSIHNDLDKLISQQELLLRKKG